MCRFIETIRIENQKVLNVEQHLKRMQTTLESVGGDIKDLPIEQLFSIQVDTHERLKLRFEYDMRGIYDVLITSYRLPQIKTLKVIEAGGIDYAHKYVNRQQFNELLVKKEGCSDILILKNGRVTDTSFTNVAFLKDEQWFTPTRPLLRGTHRALLLSEKRIEEKDIFISDLTDYTAISLFNAMINLGEIVLPIDNIIL